MNESIEKIFSGGKEQKDQVKTKFVFGTGLEGVFKSADRDQEIAYSVSYAPGGSIILQGVLEPGQSREDFVKGSKLPIANSNQYGTGGVVLQFMKKVNFLEKFDTPSTLLDNSEKK